MPRLEVREEPRSPAQPTARPRDFGAGVGVAAQQLGGQIQALGQTLEASSRERARRRAVEYRTALQNEANSIALDPDLEGRGRKFQEAQQRLLEEFRPSALTGSPQDFDFAAGITGDQIGGDLSQQTARDSIDRGIADNDFRVRELVDAAALADNQDDRALLVVEGELALAESLESGLRTQRQHDVALQKFHRDVSGAVLRKFQNDNPAGGLDFVQSDEFLGTEEEREVWRGRMISEIRAGLRAEESEAIIAEKAQVQQAKLDEQAARKRLHLILADRTRVLTVEDVLAEPSLSPEREQKYLGIAQAGGRIREPSQPNPAIYLDLSRRARRGEDVVDEAYTAYENEQLPLVNSEAIAAMSRDARFGDAADRIDRALDPGLMGDPFLQSKRDQALQVFDEWMRDHEGATREEAMKKADELIQGGLTIMSPEQIEAANLRPFGAVLNDDGRTVNLRASRDQYNAELREGIIDQGTWRERMGMLERISKAQEALRQRQAQ